MSTTGVHKYLSYQQTETLVGGFTHIEKVLSTPRSGMPDDRRRLWLQIRADVLEELNRRQLQLFADDSGEGVA